MSHSEIPLVGGQMTPGIVRIGNTVRRPVKEGAPFRHQLLLLLEQNGCNCSPRFLGIDEHDREILSFIDGEVIRNGAEYTDEALATVGAMLREVHDASAGSELTRGHDVVAHNDIAPWNTVSVGDQPVAFIDFDAAEPGSRIDDIAYMLWTFLDIGNGSELLEVQPRIALMLTAYGLDSRRGLSEAIKRQQHRVLGWRRHLATTADDENLRSMSIERVAAIRRQIDWVEQHATLIDQG